MATNRDTKVYDSLDDCSLADYYSPATTLQSRVRVPRCHLLGLGSKKLRVMGKGVESTKVPHFGVMALCVTSGGGVSGEGGPVDAREQLHGC